jgi:hypothetical protein
MPRAGSRVCLEGGLKLNINTMARRGIIRPGSATGPVRTCWTNKVTGEEIATGIITADMSGTSEGSFRIQVGRLDQHITLLARERHFGGRQWYFLCPDLNRAASVLWMPPGAHSFASRQHWGREVAYASQFMDRENRAHCGKAKINSRLCAMGGFNPDEWDLPPKPRWMRWRTYRRAEEKFDGYEAVLEEQVVRLMGKLLRI